VNIEETDGRRQLRRGNNNNRPYSPAASWQATASSSHTNVTDAVMTNGPLRCAHVANFALSVFNCIANITSLLTIYHYNHKLWAQHSLQSTDSRYLVPFCSVCAEQVSSCKQTLHQSTMSPTPTHSVCSWLVYFAILVQRFDLSSVIHSTLCSTQWRNFIFCTSCRKQLEGPLLALHWRNSLQSYPFLFIAFQYE